AQDNYCGQSENCRNCEINKLITSCFSSAEEQEQEVTLRPKNSLLPQTYRVKASPFKMEYANYLMLSFENITPIKRKRMMERIFHHDVLNKVNNLQHFVSLAQQKMDKESDISLMGNAIITGLEKIINGQRALSKAEYNELVVNPVVISIEELFAELKAFFAYPAYGHTFEFTHQREFLKDTLYTDKDLFITVLIQMVQNAVEASPLSEKIEIGCSEVAQERFRFWVHNGQCINEEDKKFIFTPSFSTKGINRGLGTYIIKLFGEGYLQGKVGFASTQDEGTTFFIDLNTKITRQGS
ncbi:MAG: HAMP domain-containing sensor histidine kinase, partial [Bacteroidales bacterium]